MLDYITEEAMRFYTTLEERMILEDMKERRVYLAKEIASLGYEGGVDNDYLSSTSQIVKYIFDCNREDKDLPVDERKPIKLFINSPGGEIGEGFALVSAIELSKTPIWTVNIGQWSSMSFYIGITGHKRLSLPHMTFLLHDGSTGAYGSTNKVQDRIKFDERFDREVIKKHVLEHGKMTDREYEAQIRTEYYMLPEDALELGFIDEIIEDIDIIL